MYIYMLVFWLAVPMISLVTVTARTRKLPIHYLICSLLMQYLNLFRVTPRMRYSFAILSQ